VCRAVDRLIRGICCEGTGLGAFYLGECLLSTKVDEKAQIPKLGFARRPVHVPDFADGHVRIKIYDYRVIWAVSMLDARENLQKIIRR